MSTEIQKATDFQTRMFERIRDSLGDLMTDEELKRVVDAAVKKAMFEPVTVMQKTDSWSSPKEVKIADSLVEKVAKELMNAMVRPLIEAWIQEHAAEIAPMIDKTLRDGIVKIVQDHNASIVSEPLMQLRYALQQKFGGNML